VRGDVVHVPALRGARGHEQQGARFGVVVQSDDLMPSTVLVVPTSSRSVPMLHRPEVTILGQRTCLLVEQARAITREALGEPVARLAYEDLRRLDDALRLALALD
jgi:mRNA interferase MazF